MQSRGTTTNAFERLPVPSVEQILVESRCQYCGSRIVSSVFEGLEEMEAEHRIRCSRLPEKMGNKLFRAD
jgi:DNA-directed RNA polymerase subunit RPC12/RpoP